MEYFDINCSFGEVPEVKLYIHEPEEILKYMKKFNITRTALFNQYSFWGNVIQENNRLLEICKIHPEFVPVLNLLPPVFESESYTKKQLENLVLHNEQLLFRISPKKQKFYFTQWQMDWQLDFLCENSVPLLVSLQEVDVQQIAQIKEQYANLKIVLTNTTQWMNRMYIQLCKHFDNVYIDTCNMIEYYGIETFVEEIGSKKILFGTYMPMKEPYDIIMLLRYAKISDGQKRDITMDNFTKLLSRK